MEKSKNKINGEENKKKSNSLIIFLIVLFLAVIGVFYYITILPKQLLTYGNKYYQIKQYNTALILFRYLGNIKPQDVEPIYYEVLTLAKMPPTYENQKRLYEISQYDDCDEASTLADNVLENIRTQIDKQAGDNYIDNVLFENSLVRWNNMNPITYSIVSEAPVSQGLVLAIDKAFQSWRNVTNGEFKFKKVISNANIVVHVVYKIPQDKIDTIFEPAGATFANIEGEKLNSMEIYVKPVDRNGNNYPVEKIYGLMLHEIGHALGIGGHSSSSGDIMHYDGDFISEATVIKNISRRDLNTLNLLYKMVPDAININLPDGLKSNLLYHEIITAYPGQNFENETQRLIKELRHDKRNVAKWVDLATNYAIKKQYPRANYILERLLPIVENNEENKFSIYYNMAVNCYKMRDYALASRYLRMAENIRRDKYTQLLNAFIDVKEKRFEAAKNQLNYLRQEYPDDFEISVKLAEIYYLKKDFKESKRIIAKLLKENPDAIRDKKVLKYK